MASKTKAFTPKHISGFFRSLLNCSLLLFMFYLPLTAQRPTDFGQSTRSGPQQTQTQEDTGPDTTVYNYVLLDDIYHSKVIDDTLGDISFLHRNPIYRDGAEMVNSGNLGSASFALKYRPEVFTTFNAGYDQYECFRLGYENFRFYEQNRPISDLFFSQLGNQDNLQVGAEFSRNFRNGLSFSLNYKRISQKGYINGQDTKNTNFGLALRYTSPTGKYTGFLLYAHNANEEGHLGGVVNEADLLGQFTKNIAVLLGDASTRQQVRDVALIQYYHLNKSDKTSWKLYLKNDLIYRPAYFKYNDKDIGDASDSLFYHNLPLDSRGLRRYVGVNRFSEGFYIHGEKEGGIQGRIGLVFDRFSVDNKPASIVRNDLTGTFAGRIPIFKALKLNATARLGLLENIGNFDIKGSLLAKAGKALDLEAGLQLFRTEPSYNSRSLVLNEIKAIDTSYTKPFGSVLEAGIRIPAVKLSAYLTQSVVNNPVYWDTLGLPRQSDEVYSVTHLRLSHRLRVWRLNLDNSANFQLASSAIYPVPSFWSTHQFYYASSWFKKVLDISIGLDARIIGDNKGPAYQPVTGEFHLSNSTLPMIPFVNLFIIGKVGAFRTMFVFENFGRNFDNRINFDVSGNSLFNPTLRFGIQWLLKD